MPGYVNIFRNTPLTLLMVLSILGLTYILGIFLDPTTSKNAFRWAIVVLAIYHGAFVCEALRSGVNTVAAGQAEAARAIGLTFSQSMREVILPQAFRGCHRPVGVVLIALIKNTTVAAVIVVGRGSEADATVSSSTRAGRSRSSPSSLLGSSSSPSHSGCCSPALSRRLAVKR